MSTHFDNFDNGVLWRIESESNKSAKAKQDRQKAADKLLLNVKQQYQVNNNLISINFNSSDSSSIFNHDEDSPKSGSPNANAVQAHAEAYEAARERAEINKQGDDEQE